MRIFESGATRDNEEGKLDYEGYLSPLVVQAFAQYMHRHQFQADGSIREGGDWKKGVPKEAYMRSLFRHFMDVWLHHAGYPEQAKESLEDALCALLFNAQGYLDTLLQGKLGPLPEKGKDSHDTQTERHATQTESQTITHKDLSNWDVNYSYILGVPETK